MWLCHKAQDRVGASIFMVSRKVNLSSVLFVWEGGGFWIHATLSQQMCLRRVLWLPEALTAPYLFTSPLCPHHLLLLSNWAFNQTIWTEELKARSSSWRNKFSASSLMARRLDPVKETSSQWARETRFTNVSVPCLVKPGLWKNQHCTTQYIFIFLSGAAAGSPGLAMLGSCSTPELQPQLCCFHG